MKLGNARNVFPQDHGFTVVELIVVIMTIGLAVCLLLPATRFSREAARRMACSNNFKQIGLAMHNYHAAFKQLPSAMGGTGWGRSPHQGNANRLSGMVALLPFMEHQSTWEQICSANTIAGNEYPAMGPAPWIRSYPAWRKQIPQLRCPSSPTQAARYGLTNYAFCIGDVTQQIHRPQATRGFFACRTSTRFREIRDGLSQTIAMAEIGTADKREVRGNVAANQPLTVLNSPSQCLEVRDASRPNQYESVIEINSDGRGGRWADGAAPFGLFSTVLPPNRPSCALAGGNAVDGVYSAGSFHEGGTHVLMGDGAVIFITDSIEAGDPSARPVDVSSAESSQLASPYGLWGALGTSTAEETIDEQLDL